jgi:hypothetical protein
MKKLLLFTAALGFFQACASAAPCTSGSLSVYIALGSAGCALGSLTVGDFAYRAKASGGAAEIGADQITVTPLLVPVGTFALQFSAPWDVKSGQDQFSRITYHIAAASATTSIQEFRLEGNGFVAGLFGSVVVNQALGPSAVAAVEPATLNLQVYEKCEEVCRSKTSATLDLYKTEPILTIADAVDLKSELGSASLSSFVDWFVVCLPCV